MATEDYILIMVDICDQRLDFVGHLCCVLSILFTFEIFTPDGFNVVSLEKGHA